MNKIECIKQLSFFDGVAPSLVISACSVKNYSDGMLFYYEGDDSQDLHFLVSGSCKAFKTSRDSELFLYGLSAGSLISDFDMDGSLCLSSVEFTSDSVVLSITFEVAIHLLPLSLLNASVARNELLNTCLDVNLVYDAAAKVSHMIYSDLYFFNSHKRVQLAAMLNMSAETISRVINRLIKSGVLSGGHGSLSVVDETKLVSFFE